MHDRLYMHLLKAKHQAEKERLDVKQKLDLFRKANRNVKLTKAIGKQYKDFEKQINSYNGLIRGLKERLKQGWRFLPFAKKSQMEKYIMADKPKYYEDLTKAQMVKIITEQTSLNLPALERATKVDISNIAKALKVNADYKGAN